VEEVHMPTKNYLSLAIITRLKDGRIECVAMEVQRPQRDKRIEFPGGSNEPQDKNDPIQTLRREVFQETGLCIKPDVDPYLLWTVRGEVEKFVYLVRRKDCSGSLRTKETIKDGESILYPIFWRDLEALGSEALLFKRHQNLLSKLDEFLPKPR